MIPDTYFSPDEELSLFAASVLLGAVLSVVYGAFSAAKMLLPRHAAITFISDLSFIALCGFSFMVFTSAAVRGEWHMYYLIGSACGFTALHLTLGAYLRRYIESLFEIIKKTAARAVRPVRKIFVAFSHTATCKFVECYKVIVKHIKKIVLLLKKPISLLYNNCVKKSAESRAHAQRKRNNKNNGKKEQKRLRRGRRRSFQQNAR